MRRIFTITGRDEAPASDNPRQRVPIELKTWRTKMRRYLIKFSTASLIAIFSSLGVTSGKVAVTLVAQVVVQKAVGSAIEGAIGVVRGQYRASPLSNGRDRGEHTADRLAATAISLERISSRA